MSRPSTTKEESLNVDPKFKCPKCGSIGNCAGAGEQDAGLCHCPNCDTDWAWDKCPPHSWIRDGETCSKCGTKDWMT